MLVHSANDDYNFGTEMLVAISRAGFPPEDLLQHRGTQLKMNSHSSVPR
jgi:hypothetical protein